MSFKDLSNEELVSYRDDALEFFGKKETAAGGQSLQAVSDELFSRLDKGQQAIERYEFVRRLSPRDFSDLCLLNINTGKPFDELVDDLLLFRR